MIFIYDPEVIQVKYCKNIDVKKSAEKSAAAFGSGK
jgi:hypothetical protein